MGTVKINAASNRLRHGNTVFHGVFFQPLHLLGVDLDLSSDHFFYLISHGHTRTDTDNLFGRPEYHLLELWGRQTYIH